MPGTVVLWVPGRDSGRAVGARRSGGSAVGARQWRWQCCGCQAGVGAACCQLQGDTAVPHPSASRRLTRDSHAFIFNRLGRVERIGASLVISLNPCRALLLPAQRALRCTPVTVSGPHPPGAMPCPSPGTPQGQLCAQLESVGPRQCSPQDPVLRPHHGAEHRQPGLPLSIPPPQGRDGV